MSTFSEQVIALIRKIPEGRLVSYGQVARVLGRPRSSRVVGTVLSALGPDQQDVPWHRVVNRNGGISPRSDPFSTHDPVARQAERLHAEGLSPNADGTYDLSTYGLGEEEIEDLLSGLGLG